MTKPRKRPEEKKKRKLTKWQLIIPPLLVGGAVGLAIVINIAIAGPPPLEQCLTGSMSSGDSKYSFHQHAYLNVTLDGQPFTVPANVGITSDCVKPLHTNDTSGMIHSQYVKPVRFTLGDFVKLWGLNLNQYDVQVFAKSFDDTDFREVNASEINTLFLRDEMRIRIQLTSR